MKRLIALSGLATTLAFAPAALAQSSPPALPELTPEQSHSVQQRLDAARRDADARVSRGEISSDEAERLLAWREWQIARHVAGAAAMPGVPPDHREPPLVQRDRVVSAPPPYYADDGPYYRYRVPYYAPVPYYRSLGVCAGGFGPHFGGRICF